MKRSVIAFSPKIRVSHLTGALLSAFLISSAYGQLADTPWPMIHHDLQHTGRSPYTGPGQPIVRWSFAANSWIQSSAAIGSDGTIYVGSTDHNLYAIDPDGQLEWSFATGSFIDSSPAIDVDGTIYVGSWDSTLYAINPDGALKWSFKADGPIPASSPAIGSDGTIYIGSFDHHLYAINSNGTLKWKFLADDEIHSTPALGSDETIYVGSHGAKLYAINPDGTQKWVADYGDVASASPAIGSDGTIFIGSEDSNVYAFHPNGQVKWSFPTGDKVISTPAIAEDGTVYVGSFDQKIYAINPNGTLKWEFTTGAVIWGSSPAIDAEGTVYVGSFDHNVYAIHPNGSLKWKFATCNEIFASVTIGSDGILYVGSKDGKLYALGYAGGEDPGDLTVGWISRSPEIDYVWGSTNPTAEGWPAAGQQVNWQAHVKNWSEFDRTGVSYKWYLDGAEVSSNIVDLPAHSTATIEYPWTWTFDRHELEFVIDPDNAVQEAEEGNNRLLIYTDAISAGFYVEQSVYDYFHIYQHELGVHSNSWEDWAQRQVARWNEMFANAVYPETPNGVLDRFRLDKITVVPNCALPLVPGGIPTNSPNLDDRTVDLQWGFPATLLDGDFYEDHTTVADHNAFYYEGSLIHELGHARYLIDTYGFNVHDDGTGNTVAITENGKLIVGTDYMPFIAWDALHYTPEDGLMSGSHTWVDRYSAMALNLITGHRATYGNYNSPENIGVFLNRDLPDENRLTIKDSTGNVLANAGINIYRATEQPGVWYGKHYDDTPDLELTTNAGGQVLLGRAPFDGDGTIDHGFALANGTIIIRVEHEQRVCYAFLEATQFNIEYWRGHTSVGDYEVRVRLIETPTAISKEEGIGEIPKEYSLGQNFPNPFNPTTKIRFDLPKSGNVTLTVYNMLGEEIATLASENLSAGKYSVEWNASNFSNGLYLYRLSAGGFVGMKKMILLK